MKDSRYYEALSSPWIRVGSAAPWDEVLQYGIPREYSKNEIIIQAGQALEAMAYLQKGVVKTVVPEENGQEKILWYIESQCVFGETPLLNGKPCAYYFKAVKDCQVYWFGKDVLYGVILVKYPEITKHLLINMARKVHVLSTQVEDQVFLKPTIRVAKLIYLYYQGKKETGWKEYPSLPVTQDEIASLLGLHRVTVNQALQTMRTEGILANNTHRIIVRDVALLKKAANLESET